MSLIPLCSWIYFGDYCKSLADSEGKSFLSPATKPLPVLSAVQFDSYLIIILDFLSDALSPTENSKKVFGIAKKPGKSLTP